MTEQQGLLATAYILLPIGLIMLAVGFYTFYYFKIGKKKKCTAETVGTIVDQAGSPDRLYPVVEFQANGKMYRKRNSASITKQRLGSIHVSNGYERGQQVTVNYDPAKPTRWMMNDSKEQMILPIMFLATGLIFVALAALFFFMA
ncbi:MULTISPECIES: DUF3592 domain-containing protein [unclassified Planococcus (in: firmicutes)]|uniref:DUF3592 domain-containing protein n=1 Tax=unclassified Planococcus (in: firmicutes) TaxID=2662419 RepID=UPI001F1A87ED|nr:MULTISPECIES: DUF3592 domain-containing protein [unclassified Planococcus (in: firmicutes)]UJF27598.1 DUF3592 domain-containing protein [Planococcus sp. 107-1]GKW47321.1 hypothetical protein NCCP2050_30130 [Planococcus sp. NCCP-2050]